MLATPGPRPSGPEWAFEAKFDGIRLIATLRDGVLRLTSRTGKDLTAAFPELAEVGRALVAAGHDRVVLDGELVSRRSGPATLQQLAPRLHRTSVTAALQESQPVTYVVFDLVELDGVDLAGLPYDTRHRRLRDLLPDTGACTVSESYADGAALWEATARLGMEGVVAKRRDSPYRAGVRSRDWVKTPHHATTDLVVIGWRPENSARTRVGSLVLAEPDGAGDLQYVGSAGSGIGAPVSDALMGVLPALARDTPVIPVPGGAGPARWVEPHLVVSVRHLGRTREHRLRQPVIVALRPDLTAAELRGEAP